MENVERIVWTLLQHDRWKLHIAATEKGLCYVGSPDAPLEELAAWVNKRLPHYDLVEAANELEPYVTELKEYLDGQRTVFALPIDLHGTAFQQSVWHALQQIPFGETVTYTQVAERLQKPSAVRAVASAIGANPVMIPVPCHRVIAKSGKLAGFRGGLDMKEHLLLLEQRQV
ncbi:methylated-DNA--[protein]-cysteine S-methyltransferase [Sporosarcina sp. 179-K 3D1 HS]|uniref:methylated-DNA--[protein]-cysteine S-methyltransferase n=1 Tax=Sporosarcina sp. 179-K 3D1 HS TaxID=3232169 RepID=UPI00399F2856